MNLLRLNETMKLLKQASEQFSMPLKKHEELADDLSAISVIVEEWVRVKLVEKPIESPKVVDVN